MVRKKSVASKSKTRRDAYRRRTTVLGCSRPWRILFLVIHAVHIFLRSRRDAMIAACLPPSYGVQGDFIPTNTIASVQGGMIILFPDISNAKQQFDDFVVVKQIVQNILAKICRRIDDQKRKEILRKNAKCISHAKRTTKSRRLEQNNCFSCKYSIDRNFRTRHIEKKKNIFQCKYYTNDQFRSAHNAKRTASIMNQYNSDEKFRKHHNVRLLNRYHSNEEFRTAHNGRLLSKYHSDEQFRTAHNVRLLNRYHSNEEFRTAHNGRLLNKYHSDEHFRTAHNVRLLTRYHSDEQFRTAHNGRLLNKYHSNNMFRAKMIRKALASYLNQISRRRNQQKTYQCICRILRKYSIVQGQTCPIKHRVTYNNYLQSFKKNIKEGPDYVCTVCRITFFRDQILPCIEKKYLDKCKSEEITARIKSYMYSSTRANSGWICRLCSEKLKRQQMSSRAIVNGLEVSEIPSELKKLNDLERHLIALRLPFMKIVNLVSGKMTNKFAQKGTKGPLHCVPSDVQDTVMSLPRPVDRSMMVRLQLKRRLKYKAIWEEQMINPNDVRKALIALKQQHPGYKDVEIVKISANYLTADKEQSDTTIGEENIDLMNIDENQEDISTEEIEKNNVEHMQRLAFGNVKDDCCDDDEEMSEDEQDVRTKFNIGTASCTQPTDLNDLVTFEKDPHVVAPAERNKLSSLLTDKSIEALAFPHLFPDGKGSFDEERETKLNWKEYCKTRLFSSDSRFASDCNYIFFLQYLGDLKHAFSGINVAFRKTLPMTAGQSSDDNNLKFLFNKDMIYRYLQSVRGSPQYWQQRLKDLFGMNRQLGIPTFFVTLSCADMRWKEFLDNMARHSGHEIKETYSFQEKASLIRKNPVLAVRMFERRFKMFMNMFIKGGACCLGKVRDWFSRIEMQLRGSPHSHMPIWVEDAPKYVGLKTDEKTRIEIVKFCDKYITTRFPAKEEDSELRDIIKEVQTHSRSHSKSCLKYNRTLCRFGFPRPIARRTFICEPFKIENDEDVERVKNAKEKLRKLNIELNEMEKKKELTWSDFDSLLEKYEWSYEQYEWSLTAVHNRPTMIHKREPNARWINQYNEEMLRAWNANMDIQFVLDAYACAKYLMSYTTKPEREMSLLLEATHKECREGNISVRDEMKKLTGTFFNHRQVSVQEAIYRAAKMPLTYSSRGFVFVPSHSNSCKFLKPRSILEKMDPNDKNIYMSNLADKYFDRPFGSDFNICMAEFASEYEIVYSSKSIKNPKTPICHLQNLPFAVKKRCDRCAIIRFPYFNREANPDDYFENLLSLYLPIRSRDELKKPYDVFYETGEVYDNYLQCTRKVKDIVCVNRKKYETNFKIASEMESIFNELSIERKEDEWAEIVANNDRRHRSEEEGEGEDNPDFDMIQERKKKASKIDVKQMFRTTDEIRPMLESLNEEQQQVFYHVRDWCMRRLHDPNIEPIRLFITGGAGTGKSHLLKCLQYEATKIFSRKKHLEADENIDEIHTLITAFTGSAAVNVGGVTIHSAFGIGTRQDRLHEPLSCDKLNTYRCKLGSLKLLFVDEVSLIQTGLWGAMHARLGQIMGIHSNVAIFGNIGIVAIGDFYQCAPVAASSIYSSMLWSDHFEYVELSVNERQKKNGSFSEMLNRIRKLKKKEQMIKEDRDALEKCHQRYLNSEYNPEALHLFAKNVDVDAHNDEMIQRVCKDIRTFYTIDKKNNEIKTNKQRYGKILHAPLRLAINSRVMITKNVAVSDGLANGVVGRVVGFIENSQNEVSRVVIKCDSSTSGRMHRAGCTHCRENDTICVTRENDNNEQQDNDLPFAATTKQFPLRLSWAMTIHKAQGLTVDEMVMSTKNLFGCGMGYTGLSRDRTIERLFLKDLHFDKFYCDENIEKMFTQMKPLNRKKNIFRYGSRYLNLIFHNVEGLHANMNAVRNHHLTKKSDLICLAETWLDETSNEKLLEIDGYRLVHRTRYSSFSVNHKMKLLNRGGVGMYIRQDIQIKDISSSNTMNFEHMIIELEGKNIILIICYRSPQQEKKEFLTNLSNLIETIDKKKRILVVGDLNENSLESNSKTIDSRMRELGFINTFQNISTTNDRTSLDCVYTNFMSQKDQYREVVGSFYSYHEPITISIDLNGSSVNVTEEIQYSDDIQSMETDATTASTPSLHILNKTTLKRKNNWEKKDSSVKKKPTSVSLRTSNNFHGQDELNSQFSWKENTPSSTQSLPIIIPQNLSQQLAMIGLKSIRILADGNCFFRAISDQLYNHENDQLKLRASAMNYLLVNSTYFLPFLDVDKDTIHTYHSRMSRNGTYVDNLAIMATAFVIKRIVVIHRFGHPPTLIRGEEGINDQVHVSYDREHFHYETVRRINGAVASISLEHLRFR